MKGKNQDFLNLNNTPSSRLPPVFYFLKSESFFSSPLYGVEPGVLGFVTGEIFIRGETGDGVKGGLSCLSPRGDKKLLRS